MSICCTPCTHSMDAIVHSLQLNPKSPTTIDSALAVLISYLGLTVDSAVHLKYSRPLGFEPEIDYCHFNVWYQLREGGGKPQPGWILAQDRPQSFSEAIFHSVWQHPEGRLVDVTPRKDNEKRLLFVPDNTRSITLASHDGKPAIHTFDNVRFLGNSLITPLTKITAVMEGNFPERHGLWPW